MGYFLMPSKAATGEDDPETQPKREIDRWRVAVDLVRRMREAGIDCELFDLSQNRH
jgi:hypothetical protein